MSEDVYRGWTMSRQVRGSMTYPGSMVKYLYGVLRLVVLFA